MTLDESAVVEFKKALDDCKRDEEGKHGTGDDYVALVLEKNGFPLLAAAYRKECEGWWYA